MGNTSVYETKINVRQAAERLLATNYRRLFTPNLEEHALKIVTSIEDFPFVIWDQLAFVRRADLSYCTHGKTTDFDHLVGTGLVGIRRAQHLELSDEEAIKWYKCGLLHDLIKNAKYTHSDRHLTDEEFAEMMQHPQNTYDFLVKNEMNDYDLLDSALRHHKWIKLNPGSQFKSYPADAGELGLAAKIMAILDTTDAVSRGRSFRMREEFKNGSVRHAIDELLRESDGKNPDGIHYDHEEVLKFIPILEKAI